MRTFRFFAISSLMLAMLVGMAAAQMPEKLTADVPFDFTVSGKTLPAGKYTIKSLTPTRLLIRGDKGDQAVIASVFSARARKIPTEASLNFARYGDQYFLYQVFVPGTQIGRELPRSEIEVQAAKTAVRTTTSIVAR